MGRFILALRIDKALRKLPRSGLVQCIYMTTYYSMVLQLSQPRLGIFYLSNTWISILPEGEGFLVVLDGFGYSFIS